MNSALVNEPEENTVINGVEVSDSSSDSADLYRSNRSDWRIELEELLKSHQLHLLLIVLLVVDVVIVIATIALEIEYLESQVEDLKEFCLSGECPLSESAEVGDHSLEHWKEILSLVSIGILSLFLVEFMANMIAIGIREFLRHRLLVVDLCVVVASIILEIMLENAPESGLLILARSWRFIRIGHGLFESLHEHDHKRLKRLKMLKRMLGPYKQDIQKSSAETMDESYLFEKMRHAIEHSQVLEHK